MIPTFTPFLPVLSAALISPAAMPDWANVVPASLKRRDPRIWQLAYAAAHQAIARANGALPRSIVIGTALGALDETRSFLDGIFKDGFGSPRNFIASVHNSMAGRLALELKIDGPNMTICDSQNSFASAIGTASLLTDADFPCLVMTVDENIEILRTLHPHLSDECKQFWNENWQESAVAVLLGKPGIQTGLRLSVCGPFCAEASGVQEQCQKAADNLDKSLRMLPLSKTSTSFVESAVATCDVILSGSAPCAIPSYSPTARSAAVIAICQ